MTEDMNASSADASLGLPCGKWLATHARIDTVEDLQAIDIRYPVNGGRIADRQDIAVRVDEGRLRWKVVAVRVA